MHPVTGISEQRFAKRAIEVIAVETLHVQNLAQHTRGHQFTQPHHRRVEEAGIAHRELAPLAFRGRNPLGRVRTVESKGLFHVDVATRGQGLQRQCGMRLRGGGDVDHVRPRLLQHSFEVVVVSRDGEADG